MPKQVIDISWHRTSAIKARRHDAGSTKSLKPRGATDLEIADRRSRTRQTG